MKIEYTGNKASFKIKKIIKKAVKNTLDFLKQEHKNIVVSVTFLSKEMIKELNNQTRNINKETDVLSYPSFELKPYQTLNVEEQTLYKNKLHLGDMALCLQQAAEQAKEYGVSLESEVKKLAIHSVLHLMGFDHIEDQDYEVMNKAEQEIDKMF